MTKDEARPWLKIADAAQHEHGAHLGPQDVLSLMEVAQVQVKVSEALEWRRERRKAVLRKSQAKHRAKLAGESEPV